MGTRSVSRGIKVAEWTELAAFYQYDYPTEQPKREIILRNVENNVMTVITDEGLDGADSVMSDDGKPIKLTPELVRLYNNAVEISQNMFAANFNEIETWFQSPDISEGQVVLGKMEFGVRDAKREARFFLPEEAGWLPSATIKDVETGLEVTYRSEAFRSLATGVAESLAPLARLLGNSVPADSPLDLSARWLVFSQSAALADLDGIRESDGQPSEADREMARLLINGANARIWGPPLDPETLLATFRRYDWPKDPAHLRKFLDDEKNALRGIEDFFAVTRPDRELGFARIVCDLLGRVFSQDGNPPSPEAGRPGYLFDAMDRLVSRLSGGRYHLRERTLRYLNDSLKVIPDRDQSEKLLVFRDPEQEPAGRIIIPKNEIQFLLFGDLDSHKPGISVDGFYLRDENGDGRIDDFRDVVEKKAVQGSSRFLEPTSVQELLGQWGKKFPPPFDVKKFGRREGGVPIADLRKWADTIHAASLKRVRWSSNPMEDGRYRVMIYRPGPSGLSADSLLFSLFVWLNRFDDVFVVPPTWGMEVALNQVAARNLPIEHLYIGSHEDKFKFGDIPLDYDRRLVFEKGATVLFTGCETTFDKALVLGSQLFRDSSGTFIWANGFNWPTPLGGLGSDGKIFETDFDHGRVMESRPHEDTPLVDPIPGGMF